jgi:cytochrome P450
MTSKRTVNLALEAARNFLARGSSGDSEQQSIIDRLVEPHLSKDVDLDTNLKALPLTEIVGHSYVLLLAGTETTALTLTGIMYHLCKHDGYKRQIRKELRELGDPDGPEYPWEKAVRTPSLVRHLPYFRTLLERSNGHG